MIVAPRPAPPESHDLLAAPQTLDSKALRLRAGLEISYARREGDGWQIVLLSHPWREGRQTAPPPV